jgi:hypothetical protein
MIRKIFEAMGLVEEKHVSAFRKRFEEELAAYLIISELQSLVKVQGVELHIASRQAKLRILGTEHVRIFKTKSGDYCARIVKP